MRQLNKTLLRVLYILLLSILLALPGMAADSQASDLRVYPVDEREAWDAYQSIVTAQALLDDGDVEEAKPKQDLQDETEPTEPEQLQVITDFVTGDAAFALIDKYEGFTATRIWDYSRWSIGYGSSYEKALEWFPEIKTEGMSDDEVTITKEQGLILLQDDLNTTEQFLNGILEKYQIPLNQNQFDALVSFTYNVGSGWWTYTNSDDGSYCLLRQMLQDDPSTWTEERAQTAFGTWRNAGGQVLPGLVARRAEEATLFMTPYDPSEEDPSEPDGTVKPAFDDLEDGAWYMDYVTAAYELGLMQGYDESTFGPDDSLTRAQMVQVLANLSQVDLTAYAGKNGGFTDVPATSWFAPAIAWASELGLVNGRGDGTFDPDEPISRQHLCSIMARYLRLFDLEPDATIAPFDDDAEMDDTSREDVYYCAAMGLVNGMGENSFAPKAEATRAQLAKILVGMYALVGDNAEAA